MMMMMMPLAQTAQCALSARMGLEVSGAMMNTPQQKDIPNS
jgi:hypothetical protein